MSIAPNAPAEVVDFLEFRARRAQRQLEFDGVPELAPSSAAAARRRPLSEREVEHRARMVAFLGRQKSEAK